MIKSLDRLVLTTCDEASGTTGKALGSFYYVQQYLREQSQTVVD